MLNRPIPPDEEGKERPEKIPSLDEVVLAHVPEVLLTGEISAKKELNQAEWYTPGAVKGVPLTGFKPEKTFAIREKLELKPGPQTYRIRAWTEDSVEADVSLKIEYRPPVPEVRLIPPHGGEIVYGEAASGEIELSGRIDMPKSLHPFRPELVLLVDGDKQAEVEIDERTGTFKVRAKLKPGIRRIRIRASNKWTPPKDTKESNELRVRYLARPRS